MAPPTIGDILSRVIQRQAPLRTIQSVRPRSITARYLALFMWTLMSSSSSQTRWRRTEVSPKASGFLKKPAMTTQKKRNQMLIFSPSCAGLTRVSTWISGSGPRLSGLNLELALSPLPSSSGLTRGSTCQGREAVGIGDFHPFPPPQEHRAVDPRVKPEDDDREEANIVSRIVPSSHNPRSAWAADRYTNLNRTAVGLTRVSTCQNR